MGKLSTVRLIPICLRNSAAPLYRRGRQGAGFKSGARPGVASLDDNQRNWDGAGGLISLRVLRSNYDLEPGLDAVHGDHGLEALDVGLIEKEAVTQLFIFGHIRHRNDQQEIELTSHIIALLDFRGF